MDISELDQSSLDGEDLPRLIFIPVEDAYNLLWERNPKLHNIGELIQSFVEHGFQEFPKYDATLGAIKAGNGRIEAMYLMAKDATYKDKRPRGIAQTKDGRWAMPLLVGTDAKSVDMAISYAIDSNNLTLTGGNFTVFDITRMWDEDALIKMGAELATKDIFPVSMDPDTIDTLIKIGRRKESIKGFLDDLLIESDYEKSKSETSSSRIPYVNLLFTATEQQRDYVMGILSAIRDTSENINTMLDAIIFLCEDWETRNGEDITKERD